jgi:pullulanase/glycogen debranching enzyme
MANLCLPNNILKKEGIVVKMDVVIAHTYQKQAV